MAVDMTEKLLAEAKRLGAAEAEVYRSCQRSLSIEVSKGEVENLALSDTSGIGVRVFTANHQMGFAFFTEDGTGGLRVVEEAWHNAQANAPDEAAGLAQTQDGDACDWIEEDFEAIPVERKTQCALALERKTIAAREALSYVPQAAYNETVYAVDLANSTGLRQSFRTAYCGCYAQGVAAREGVDSETGVEFDVARRFDGLDIDHVADVAADKAVAMLGASPCKSQAMPVVLDRGVTAQFLQVLGSGLMADNVVRGQSLFRDALGETVACEAVTIIDQNDAAESVYRAPFDAEGTPAHRTVAVDGGVLKSFFHNAYTARRMGATSTSNAVRGGFRGTPGVGATNLYLKPGRGTREDLLGRAGTGFYMTKAMGLHMANPISGDFSFGASGFLIENGTPARPVRGVTVAGNIREVMARIEEVADDLRFYGAYGAPSVLISSMPISGE